MSFENLSDHTLVLNSVMFETRDHFYEGFVVDYVSAAPPVKGREKKIGNIADLFFSEDEVINTPSEKYSVKVEIVANHHGDYSDNFCVFSESGMLESEALGVLLDHEEKFKILIPPGE